jgi:hypothetical protein
MLLTVFAVGLLAHIFTLEKLLKRQNNQGCPLVKK